MERDFEAALAMLHEMEENGELELRTQSFKIHPEGNWPAEVAPMLEPYETGKMGTFNVEPDKIAAIILAAAQADMDVATHSDSSGTARAVIDGILAARDAEYPSRSAIHHASWINPDDQKRIIGHRIPINTTPNFSNDFSGTDQDALRLLGEERTRTMFGRYPYFARGGVSVSLSADVPSTPPEMQAPLFVIQGAVTLKNPADPNSRRFPPDLVVLDRNPFDVDPMELSKIDVLMTMMNARFTYQAVP